GRDGRIGRRRGLATVAGACPARAGKGVAENLAENIAVAVERITARPPRAEFESRTASPLLAAKPVERIAAAGRALKTLETRLAVSVDLAAIKGGTVLLVADDLIGLV